MADEPRRSGRATKGQHTKDREGDEASAKGKGKGRGKKSKAEPEPTEEEDEEENEIIRCICGQYEEEEDNPRSMICCDNCSAWQHNDCMGLPEDYEVEKYFCEQCRPQDHKELLAAIKRGEKPWEEAAKRRELAEAEKTNKKKGKKGRKSGASRASETQRTPTLEPEEPTSKKRKLEDTPVQDSKAKKARGTTEETNGDRSVSAGQKESATPAKQDADDESNIATPVADVKELTNGTRKSAASGLIKLFVEQAKAAVKSGDLPLPTGITAQSVGTRTGLEVENAVYHVQSGGTGEPVAAYKDQLRTILYNVKNNPALTVQLMTGDLTAERLASMQAKDMASDEQKQKDAEILKEMERQNTIVEEQGPRIRRTHKGEEYVDENRQIAAESTTSRSNLRKPSAVTQDVEMKSPDASTPGDKILRKPSAASKGRPFGDPRRKSSSNFDIDKVWSGVQGSPTESDAPRFPEISKTGSPQHHSGAAGADPEIDDLLKDEDGESEPYSPKEYTEEGVIWRGRINGGSLGNFISVAKFAAGAQPDADTLRMSWTEVIPAEIKLHGRIQPGKADDYLCGLEYSNTTELIIVSIAEPKSAHDSQQFDKFFKYLKNKERYGVGMQHQVPAIKDIYLLPLEVGQPLPTVMKALEHSFPDPVEERQFLVPIVIKWTELPHNIERLQQEGLPMSPSVGPPVAQTPITPHENHPPSQQYPVASSGQSTMQPVNGATQPQSRSATHYSPPPPPYGNMPTQTTPAAANALRILGPELALAPAVVELVQQAPNAGENEFNIIKECILENPEAARSLIVLTQTLQAKHGARTQAQNQNQAHIESKANVQA